MASLNDPNFDASKTEIVRPWEAIPEGAYPVEIVKSERRTNRAGTGSYLEIHFEVIEGPQQGRQVIVRLNDDHPSERAVRMAKSDLAKICLAAGHPRPSDTVELHNVPLWAEVVVKRRKDNGELANEIVAYHPREQAPDAASSPHSDPRGDDPAPWCAA